MEESKNKEKKQPEKTEEKEKQPAGKDKEKKEDQELVREGENVSRLAFCLSHSLRKPRENCSL